MIQYTVHKNPSTGSVSLERTNVNTVDNNTTASNTVDSTGGYYGTIHYTNSQYQNNPTFTTISVDFASKSDVEYRAVILKEELMTEIKLLRQRLDEAMNLIDTLWKFKEDIENGVDPIKLEKDDTMFESLFENDK